MYIYFATDLKRKYRKNATPAAIQEQEQEAGEHIGDHDNATTNEPIPADEVEEQDVDQRE